MSVIEIKDDGFIDVTIGETTVNVDLYEVNNRIQTIQQESADGEATSESLNNKIAAYVMSLGFPRVSHRAAVKFNNAIIDMINTLKKKDAWGTSPLPNAVLQSFTDSPSSD